MLHHHAQGCVPWKLTIKVRVKCFVALPTSHGSFSVGEIGPFASEERRLGQVRDKKDIGSLVALEENNVGPLSLLD